MSHLNNFGLGLHAMLEHDRSTAYAVQVCEPAYNSFTRGNVYQPTEQEISLPLEQFSPPAQPEDPPSPIQISRTPSYQGSPLPDRTWPLARELDSMYESDFLDEQLYYPDLDRSPRSTHSAGQPSPYLANAEDLLSTGLFGASHPAFFVQPPTRNSTILSPPLHSLDYRLQFPKGVSPESSVGDDHLTSDPSDLLFRHRSRTHSRASSISSSHTQGLSASQFGTGASTSPALLPGDVPELSPHITDFHNLQIHNDQWPVFMSASTTSPSNSDAGSNVGSSVASPHNKPTSPPSLIIPSDTPAPSLGASLFEASQPGLAPPLPSLGLIPATPVTPPQVGGSFQEILRQQVAHRRAQSPLLSGSQPSDNGSISQVPTPPHAPDSSLQHDTWPSLLVQPQMPPVPTLPSLPDTNIFPHLAGVRPAIGSIPAGASSLGVYTTRSRSHSDPPASQWGAALPPAIRPSPTHGQGNTQMLGMSSVDPGMLGSRIPEINVGVGGSVWDNAIDPMLGNFSSASIQRARSVGDNNGNRRGHIRNARSEDVSSAYQGGQLYTMSDGSLAPPAMVPSSVPSELDEGGVGPKRRGHERSNSGSHRASPYHSPHVGPRSLPGDDSANYGGITLTKPVERVHVTTPATREASSNRRTAQANFKCPVPGCGSTFTRHFNLRGHIRSHNEERPFKCKWPGCDKGFARQHDCKRHEALHLNIRPYTCDGCQKTFARMDALNRHLRSEGGTECQRVQSEVTEANTPENNAQTDWQAGSAGSGSVLV